MLKKTIIFSLLAVFLISPSAYIARADAPPKEQAAKEKQAADKSSKTKKSKAPKEAPAAVPIPLEENEVAAPKQEDGPPYPFIYENGNESQLSCKDTPFIEPEYANKKPINKGNNLMRKAGGAARAVGNYIQISGMVVDENCLPIQGAVIEIWQADAAGRYEWEYDVKSHWEQPLAGKDNNFLFSGSAHTDNLGQFNLLTIFPGAKDENAPYINVIVKREGYDNLHTRMYFRGHPRNDTDPTLALMKGDGKESIIVPGQNIDPKGAYEGRVYYFRVVMNGIDAYKRF